MAEIVVFPTYESKKNSSAVDKDSFSDGTVSPAAQVDLPDGIGGRVRIHQNGSILTTRVKTPTSSQVAPGAGEAYLYAGFGKSDGSVETDIGLIWSTTYELWKPYFLYNNGQADKGYFVTPYNEVQYKNGFIPGEIINFTIYKNYNGKIRYKAEGYAKYSDRNGNGGVTWLISVMESNKTPSIGNVDYWKVLATVAKSETGKVYGEFMDIKLDGSTPTLGTPEEDHAKITVNQNQGKVTISVNSDLY